MPVVKVDGVMRKMACARCIRGHRASKCNHTDRPLLDVRKPGRPLTSCPHGPERRCSCERLVFDRGVVKGGQQHQQQQGQAPSTTSTPSSAAASSLSPRPTTSTGHLRRRSTFGPASSSASTPQPQLHLETELAPERLEDLWQQQQQPAQPTATPHAHDDDALSSWATGHGQVGTMAMTATHLHSAIPNWEAAAGDAEALLSPSIPLSPHYLGVGAHQQDWSDMWAAPAPTDDMPSFYQQQQQQQQALPISPHASNSGTDAPPWGFQGASYFSGTSATATVSAGQGFGVAQQPSPMATIGAMGTVGGTTPWGGTDGWSSGGKGAEEEEPRETGEQSSRVAG